MPPRLVRRTPLAERVKAMLNPMDFLLWLSEEIETREWSSKVLGTQLGLAMNFAFLLARANSARSTAADDVFGDGGSSGWVTFVVRAAFAPRLCAFLEHAGPMLTATFRSARWFGSSPASLGSTLSTP